MARFSLNPRPAALALLLLPTLACKPATEAPAGAPPPAVTTAEIPWEDEIQAWKQLRDERLRRPDGWLTLVGFAWLAEGENAVGSDPKAPIVLPAGKSPARLGILKVHQGAVEFVAAEGVVATSKGTPVTRLTLASDHAADGPTPIEHGPLTFTVIERAGRLAVRVRDREAATLAGFAGMDYFPLDRAWRFEGRFEPAAEVRELPIPNVLGFDEKIPSPGHVVFERDGEEHRLLALDDTGDGRLFLVFGDSTNGRETYGGGRFLYADPPVDGRVVIDFNRAYNPPCVFTPYATCPLPPRGNRLPFPVPAGEKRYRSEAPHPEQLSEDGAAKA